MCGIAGFIQRKIPDPVIIDRMTDSLAHRGPDGRGTFTTTHNGWHVSLGHRRLSIIDLAGGHQPLGNEDGSIQITFNGEIYNFQQLRESLIRDGHRFATRSDTEVIVHDYEQRGFDSLRDLDGMFAFGIWDGRNGELRLARDRIGIKPLYYAPLPDGGLAFASELRSLMQHPDIPRDLDRDALACFFFCDYIHPPRTILKDVRKLPPAHTLVWKNGTISPPQPFWTLDVGQAFLPVTDRTRSDFEAAQHLRQILLDSVHAQMISDVPVGVFLSGGIDSSLVASIAQKISPGKLKTFSIGFEDAQFDESKYARIVADHLGTQHIEQTYRESDLLDNLDRALSSLDEPLGDPSILPTYAVSKLAAEHVKVALGGDGGDELFAGYPTYKAAKIAQWYSRIPAFARESIARLIDALPVSHAYQSFDWKARRFAHRWDDDPIRRHLRWMSSTDLAQIQALIPGASFPIELLPGSVTSVTLSSDPDINTFLALDLQTYLPGSVLTKVDRASMAHSLEVRPPLLHGPMVDFAFSLPPEMKLRGKQSKFLLKRVAHEFLPQSIIHRKKKGFAIPLARWLAGPLRERLESITTTSPIFKTGLLDQPTTKRWLQEHITKKSDRSKPLWALLVLDHWATQLAR